MIRSWSLTNFKSVAEANLKLAPLTLFAGANSSGKSTLLQSILLITQTLSSRAANQRIVLNGHLAKLGQFDDLKTKSTETNAIGMAWTVTQEAPEEPSSRVRRGPVFVDRAACDLIFGISPQKNKVELLNPHVFEVSLSCDTKLRGEEQLRTSYIHIKRQPHTAFRELEQPAHRGQRAFTTDYDIDLDPESMADLQDEFSDAKPIGCAFQTFLPSTLIVQFDEKKEIIKFLISALLGAPRQRSSARNLIPSSVQLSPEFTSRIVQELPQLAPYFRQLAPTEDPSPLTLLDVFSQIRSAPPLQLTSDDAARIERVADATLNQKFDWTIANLPDRTLEEAIDFLRDFFSQQVKYLGPLREEPRALYPLQNTADPQDVGLHGEHTAAVLHRFKYTQVTYIPPLFFEKQTEGAQPVPTKGYLEDAVYEWLDYLDVARKVDTSDEGKFGYGLSVTLSGSAASHDLTHVGVGVSQVLPIVVMCLLARHDTTLILEQPELHLNPKVQTRLADFFLSIALLRKQCLIETHSEYMINRLRFRVAAAPGTTISDLLRLYFVEKIAGLTTYRDVVINQFGALMRWPEGFFDQSQREIEEIILAATKKQSGTQG